MRFAKKHTNSSVFYIDTNTIFNSILANASSYGFKNTTGYCPEYDAPDFNTNYSAYGCLAPYEYFWYSKYCIDVEYEPLTKYDVLTKTRNRYWSCHLSCA